MLSGFGALAQFIGSTAIPFLRKYIVPAAKSLGADLLDFDVPEIADVVISRKNLKTKSVGSQTLRKQLNTGSKKRIPSSVIPSKSAKQASWLRRDNSTNNSHYSC